MAKIIDTLVTDETASASPMREPVPPATPAAPEVLKFRDKLYTSRLLIVPGSDRSYPIDKALVEVPASDTEAVKFLKASEEYEPFKE
ncbi:hypothetical protein [Pseudomonas fragi]|uniref:hypothetical protein n=1 Tax=Pseudomonas fragi TaxID=296 RepID=UPI000BA28213|nr:hypothetical protein [Pseudomonas fragi]PAA08015.1 hypothetical protein CJU78_11975 [Pseudomonas fragi]